jgi:tRNA threonylcarbamoyladenosine modification (KEOPS) complex  Pcc1 subunit
LSRNKKISVKISLKGDKRTVESLKKALDGSKVVDNILIIVFDSDDIGDARAFINSTLRVINASVNSLM